MILRGLGDDMDLVGMCCATCAAPTLFAFPLHQVHRAQTRTLLLPLLNIVLCTLAPTKTYIRKFPALTYLLIVQGYTFLHKSMVGWCLFNIGLWWLWLWSTNSELRVCLAGHFHP